MEKELVYSWLLIGPLGFEEWVLGDTGKVVRRPVQKSKNAWTRARVDSAVVRGAAFYFGDLILAYCSDDDVRAGIRWRWMRAKQGNIIRFGERGFYYIRHTD